MDEVLVSKGDLVCVTDPESLEFGLMLVVAEDYDDLDRPGPDMIWCHHALTETPTFLANLTGDFRGLVLSKDALEDANECAMIPYALKDLTVMGRRPMHPRMYYRDAVVTLRRMDGGRIVRRCPEAAILETGRYIARVQDDGEDRLEIQGESAGYRHDLKAHVWAANMEEPRPFKRGDLVFVDQFGARGVVEKVSQQQGQVYVFCYETGVIIPFGCGDLRHRSLMPHADERFSSGEAIVVDEGGDSPALQVNEYDFWDMPEPPVLVNAA